ncbi:hypothetical protein IMCC9480_1493 [Oxalobacteraceae bacterium IMCC9480]|nr:hypothetical protein IMCC9480_1493 [Oxalobacteraceae bacterium IMCC9480]
MSIDAIAATAAAGTRPWRDAGAAGGRTIRCGCRVGRGIDRSAVIAGTRQQNRVLLVRVGLHLQRDLADHRDAAGGDQLRCKRIGAGILRGQIRGIERAHQRDAWRVAVRDLQLDEVGILDALAGSRADGRTLEGLAAVGNDALAVRIGAGEAVVVPVGEALAGGILQRDADIGVDVAVGFDERRSKLVGAGAAAVHRHQGLRVGITDSPQIGMLHAAGTRRHEGRMVHLVAGEIHHAVLQDGQTKQGDQRPDHGELDHRQATLAEGGIKRKGHDRRRTRRMDRKLHLPCHPAAAQ